jgi:hypothetical protein
MMLVPTIELNPQIANNDVLNLTENALIELRAFVAEVSISSPENLTVRQTSVHQTSRIAQ